MATELGVLEDSSLKSELFDAAGVHEIPPLHLAGLNHYSSASGSAIALAMSAAASSAPAAEQRVPAALEHDGDGIHGHCFSLKSSKYCGGGYGDYYMSTLVTVSGQHVTDAQAFDAVLDAYFNSTGEHRYINQFFGCQSWVGHPMPRYRISYTCRSLLESTETRLCNHYHQPPALCADSCNIYGCHASSPGRMLYVTVIISMALLLILIALFLVWYLHRRVFAGRDSGDLAHTSASCSASPLGIADGSCKNTQCSLHSDCSQSGDLESAPMRSTSLALEKNWHSSGSNFVSASSTTNASMQRNVSSTTASRPHCDEAEPHRYSPRDHAHAATNNGSQAKDDGADAPGAARILDAVVGFNFNQAKDDGADAPGAARILDAVLGFNFKSLLAMAQKAARRVFTVASENSSSPAANPLASLQPIQALQMAVATAPSPAQDIDKQDSYTCNMQAQPADPNSAMQVLVPNLTVSKRSQSLRGCPNVGQVFGAEPADKDTSSHCLPQQQQQQQQQQQPQPSQHSRHDCQNPQSGQHDLPGIPAVANFDDTQSAGIAVDGDVNECDLFTVLYPYSPAENDELSIVPGERVRLLRLFSDGWTFVQKVCDGRIGAVPAVCLDTDPTGTVNYATLNRLIPS
ncbi:hypothetical protein GQ54DRAFT_314609 [Martensiomyces pterosporus]|nr:hypothetical protein GQ54DRAFT_314609 [Martensiomyces pterosporus]